MNHDMTVNNPSGYLVNIIASPGMGDKRFLLSCVSDVHIDKGDTITFDFVNGSIVKVCTAEVLESEFWIAGDGREVYLNLMHIDR